MASAIHVIRTTAYCSVFTGLFVVVAGFGGCPGGGTDPPPPPDKDAVWCDVQAVPCTALACGNEAFPLACDPGQNPTFCNGVPCDTLSCLTMAASPQGGRRACFSSAAGETPEGACANICNVLSGELNLVRYPASPPDVQNLPFLNLRTFCSSAINTDPAFHTNLNPDGFEPNGCMDPGPGLPLPATGTHTVMLAGAGTATLDGGGATTVPISGGNFTISAPNTSCSALEQGCEVMLVEGELAFANFSFSGHSVSGLRIFLDQNVITSSGQLLTASNTFIFTIPPDVFFDAKATVDGSLTGLVVSSSQEVFGSINLATNEVAFQFDVAGDFGGQLLEISGTALTAAVAAVAPVVTAPGSIVAQSTAGTCSADVTLSASASSAAGLPVQLFYSTVELGHLGSGPSVIASFGVGTHEVTITGMDSNGMPDTAVTTVVVNDDSPPSISAPPDMTLTSCTNVDLGDAVATDDCDGSVTVTNNAPAQFSAGTTIVTWTATDANGNQGTAQQRVTVVLGDDASCCPPGTNVILGTSNDDRLNGTNGPDCILTFGAQDTVNGLGGNDFISTGEGDDVVDAGSGNDFVSTGNGQDRVVGGSGNDTVFGGGGDDNLRGGIGDDTLNGGQGQDQLLGEAGNDLLSGNDGDDNLQGGDGNDDLVGGVNNDTCNGGGGTNTFAQCEFGAPNSCTDGVANGTESDVDCGGACSPCAVGDSCETTADCESNVCSSGVCQPGGGDGGTGTLSTSISISTDWGSGYCAVLHVTNNAAEETTSFTVQLDTNASTIYDSWNGNFSGTSGVLNVPACCDWNSSLEPGATDSSIGFCANRNVAGSGTLPIVLGTTATF